MARDGLIEKRAAASRPPGALPPVLVLRVTGADADGDLWAEPAEWEADGPPPRILIRARRDDPGARRRRPPARAADGRSTTPRRRSPPASSAASAWGRAGSSASTTRGEAGGRIAAIDKRTDRDWLVAPGDRAGAREGELVEAEQLGAARGHGLPRARVVARLGDPSAPRSVSLIAIHEHGIPDEFPDAALAEAEAARPVAARRPRGPARAALRHHRPLRRPRPRRRRLRPPRRRPREPRRPRRLGGDRRRRRTTSAPAARSTARPAAAATPPTSPTASCRCCPSALSGDLCSLVDGADRPCIAVRLTLDAEGHERGHRFTRGADALAATLTYSPGPGRRRRPPRRHDRAAARPRHPPALGRLARRPPRPRPAPAAEPRPARAPHRARRRRPGALGRLPRAPRRPPRDRGLHDPRQRRRRRDAGGEAPAPALPRPRGAEPREARGAARDRRGRSA